MATIYNNPQKMTVLGSQTPKTVIYKSESHKLHQAFPVKMNEGKVEKEIIQGMPVALNADGSVSPYEGTGVFLGIAMTDSITPAYPAAYPATVAPEVTVAVEGYCIVMGQAKKSDSYSEGDVVPAGAVTPKAAEEDSLYIPYSPDAVEAHPKFLALNPASEEGDLIQVLVR